MIGGVTVSRLLVATAITAALLLAVTGCTATSSTPLAAHIIAHPATPTPATSVPPTSAPTPAATAAGCHGWGFWARGYYSEAQQPVDCGPIQFATGTAELDGNGVPVAYVVAPGDIYESIAQRFDVGTGYLNAINAVRREWPMIVYAGDTINLDPATIATVGDQDGVAYDYEDRMPTPHVPQH
jgi:hypothetical protein